MIRIFQERAHQKIAGFQSPADDHLEGRLDIKEAIVVDPENTFYVLMQGDNMTRTGVKKNELLVIDKSLKLKHGCFATVFHEGEFITRLFELHADKPALIDDNGVLYPEQVDLFGVVMVGLDNKLPKSLRVGKYRHVCSM